MTMIKKAILVVEGKVQNVGYRDFVEEKAMEFNILGEIENLEDRNKVRIIAEADEETIKKFIESIKVKKYPISVNSITEQWNEPSCQYKTFEIKRGNLKEEMFERADTAVKYLRLTHAIVERVDENTSKTNPAIERMHTDMNAHFDKLDTKYGKISKELRKGFKKTEQSTTKGFADSKQSNEEGLKQLKQINEKLADVLVKAARG